MPDDLDDLRQLAKNSAKDRGYIACDGCGATSIVADVCPLCECTYCGRCIIGHVESELARLEQQWGIAETDQAKLEDEFA